MAAEVWVLGGTGRSGRAIATDLVGRGAPTVLVGRDAAALEAAAGATGATRVVVAGSPGEMASAIRRGRPAVVVNTVGPFQTTAGPLADAALESGGYVDLANDVGAFLALRRRDDEARRRGRTLVTGAGFGVTATESLVTWLVGERPPARTVRVDMIPSLATAARRIGEALAGSVLDGLPGVPGGGRFQGRCIADGQLAPAPVGGRPVQLTTPDGDRVTTGLIPLGELLAAQHAARASSVDAASSEVPSGAVVRRVLPVGLRVLHVGPVRRFLTRRLAAVTTSERPRPRQHSWAHARVEWADATHREGWLRLDDAGDFTAAVAAQVANRLLDGEGRPGVHTPAALFGPSLAEACGATYLLDGEQR